MQTTFHLPSRGNGHCHGLGSWEVVELKEKYCKPSIPKEALLELSLPGVDDKQFHVLVEYWFSKKGMVVIIIVV